MLIFQYKCKRCLSTFEQAFNNEKDVKCFSCGGRDCERVEESLFAKIGGCGSPKKVKSSYFFKNLNI